VGTRWSNPALYWYQADRSLHGRPAPGFLTSPRTEDIALCDNIFPKACCSSFW
jgi:hypothetical protein